jgi:hypothetical protein
MGIPAIAKATDAGIDLLVRLALSLARWRPGTMQRRTLALAKYTGQQCGDIAAMTRAPRKSGAIRVVEQKTGAELWIPEHSDVAVELARGTGCT